MRTVKEYFKGENASDGAGVKLYRCFGYYDIPKFDPYLMMDFFDSTDPEDYIKGFPWHPHRGIDTITYLIKGEMEHADSIGNRGTIGEGQCQWMSAGSGILHQEMPKASEHMLGSQIWLNLSSEEKMRDPAYRDITEDLIAVVEEKEAIVRVLAGEYKGVKGPLLMDKTQPLYLDIEIQPNSHFKYRIKKDLNAFAFVAEGAAGFQGEDFILKRNGVLFNMDGEEIVIKTGDEKARILLLAGRPLNEEIAWGGPIVMNTRDELDQAFRDLDNNTFIK